jgi:hypothetical protein
VLLGLDACLSRGVFTETQKAADLITKFRHRFEVREMGCFGLHYIV